MEHRTVCYGNGTKLSVCLWSGSCAFVFRAYDGSVCYDSGGPGLVPGSGSGAGRRIRGGDHRSQLGDETASPAFCSSSTGVRIVFGAFDGDFAGSGLGTILKEHLGKDWTDERQYRIISCDLVSVCGGISLLSGRKAA